MWRILREMKREFFLSLLAISVMMIGPVIAMTLPGRNVEIVHVSGERGFTISIPPGKKTLRGYLVTDSGKKRVNVTIEVDQDSGSVSWKE